VDSKKIDILNTWGGDLELRLLAIGLQRDVAVVTAATNGSTFGRLYPSQPPQVKTMIGGIFIPLTAEMLCNHWKPTPLLNGTNHYDSTLCA